MNTRRSGQNSVTSKPPIDRRRSPRLRKDGDRPASPENHCPICLGDVINKSFTNSCLHEFCFRCLREWSKIKAECPLCKQQFTTIYHNIRANDDYDEHKIPPPQDIFLTLRHPSLILRPAAELYTDGNAFSMYFPLWRNETEQELLGLRRREDRFVEVRRRIYRDNLWSRPNTMLRLRDSHPEFYSENPALIHRLTPWLLRELSVLLDNSTYVPTLVSQIETLITDHLIVSDHFHHSLSPYLGERTAHFIHEFYHFAISPYDMLLHDIRNSYYNPSDAGQQSQTSGSILSSRPNTDRTFEEELTLRIIEIPPSPYVPELPINEPRSEVIDLITDSEDETVVVSEIAISDSEDDNDIEVVDEVIPKQEVILISSSSEEESEHSCPCPINNKCPYSKALLYVMRSKHRCTSTCRKTHTIPSDSSQTLTCHPSDSDCPLRYEDRTKRIKKFRKTRRRARTRSPEPSSSRVESYRRSRSDRPMPSTSRAPSVTSTNSDSDSTYKLSLQRSKRKRSTKNTEKSVKTIPLKRNKLKSVVFRPNRDSD